MSLTALAPDWAKEHIGGPLHLQVAAPPAGLQRGYMYRSMPVQPVRYVLAPDPSVAPGSWWGRLADLRKRGAAIETRYDLRTVCLRDEAGHLRMWTGYVAEGYWS